MRIDKFLADLQVGTRTEVKAIIKKKRVAVNGVIVKSASQHINENADEVTLDGTPLHYQKYYYYLLHKPAGVITATQDAKHKTVMDLFKPEDYRKDLFPVGRLDKDTEGLLLITNDGDLSYQLLAPQYHVDKTYYIESENALTPKDVDALAQDQVRLNDTEFVKGGKLEILMDHTALLTISEGKFHQVKRMFHAIDNQVNYLKRVTFGPLTLPEDLTKGKYRPLTEEEIQDLRNTLNV
jgi:16S rRNA pseudouridine516 synthase